MADLPNETDFGNLRAAIFNADEIYVGGLPALNALTGDTVARAALTYVRIVPDRAAMAAIIPSVGLTAYEQEAGREGNWRWVTGNFSAQVADDPDGGAFYPSTVTGFPVTSGVWRRIFGVEGGWSDYFGAPFNDNTKDAAAICSRALNVMSRYFGLPLRMTPGTLASPRLYTLGSSINVRDNAKFFGAGPLAKWVPSAADLADGTYAGLFQRRFVVYGVNPEIAYHYIDWATVNTGTSSTTNGFINIDNTGVNSPNLYIHDNTIMAPLCGKNGITLKGYTTADNSAIRIENNTIQAGRMGVEAIGQNLVDLLIFRNKISNCGACSPSGANVSLSFNAPGNADCLENSLGGGTKSSGAYTLWVEMVGSAKYRVNRNVFSGTGTCVSSNVNGNAALEFKDNSSVPGTLGSFQFQSSPGAQIEGNNFLISGYTGLAGNTAAIAYSGVGGVIRRNRVTLDGTATNIAVQLYNATNVTVEENDLDSSAYTGTATRSTVFVHGANSPGCIVRNNRIATGPNMPAQSREISITNESPVGIYGNRSFLGATIDNKPVDNSLVITGTAKVRTVTNVAAFVSASVPVRVRVSGAGVFAEAVFYVTFAGGSAPVVDGTQSVSSSGITLATTTASNVLTITATVTGTLSLTWSIDAPHTQGAGFLVLA